MDHQFLKVGDFGNDAGAIYAQQFLRKTRVSFAAVNQLAARAVAEFNLGSNAVGKRESACGRPGGLRQNADRARVEQETKVIEKMARLTEHPSAAFGVVRIPMLRVKLAAHHAKTRGLRPRRRRQGPFQLPARRREAAVEPHHQCALALRVNLVDFGQFLSREAKRFLNENVTARSERLLYQRPVQMMARGNEDGGWSVGLQPRLCRSGVRRSENLRRIGCRAFEAEPGL